MRKYNAAFQTGLLAFITCILLSTIMFGVASGQPLAKAEKDKVLSASGYQGLVSQVSQSGTVRIIVRVDTPFRPFSDPMAVDSIQQQSNILSAQKTLLATVVSFEPKNVHQYRYVPYIAMEVDASALEAVLASPLALEVHEDRPVALSLDLSVPRISAPVVWNKGYKGEQTVVAVLDAGVDKNHPFLSGSVVSEACYSSNYTAHSASSVCPGGVTASTADGSAMNCPAAVYGCFHGTHVAGIIAGRQGIPGSPGPGVAPAAGVIAIQVFSRIDNAATCSPYGTASCVSSYPSDQIKGLERVYALRGTYNIASVNMSLGGGQYYSNCDSMPIKPIIDNLKAAGIATVIASGNENFCGSMGSPACVSSAVSVGATTDTDSVASYSNSATFLNLLAPGSSINSSMPSGPYASLDGTSMAAPHVAGAWALMRQAYPSASVDEILAAFTSTGLTVTDTGKCGSVTKKRINVDDALGFLVSNPTFAVSVAPRTVTVAQGATGTATLTTSVSGGFNNSVSLSATGLPTGVTAAFTPATITAPGTGASTLTLNVAASAIAGGYTVMVTGTGGGVTKQIAVTLTVTDGSTTTLFSNGFESAADWT